MSEKINYLWVTLLVSLTCAGLVLAQVTTASISGTVRDETGAVLPGVTINAVNTDTGIARTVISDDEGRYHAVNLAVGPYEIRAELTGFQSSLRRGIQLTIGREAVVDFALRVGEITETIEVTGEALLVNTTSSTIEGLVDEKTISDLPLNGRSYIQLAELQPGVNPMRTNSSPGLSISGGRSTENNFLLDGINTNDSENKTPVSKSGVILGVEAIREFSVLTSNFSAEYGRGGGGIINAVTKSGTNQLHGSVFAYHRNDNLDSTGFFDRELGNELPEFKRNQFGFSVGGPIRTDSTFFFGSYEGLFERRGLTATSQTFGQMIQDGFAPLDGGGFIDVGVDPDVDPYLKLYPLPNGELFSDGTGDFSFTNNQVIDENYFMVRLDHQLGENDSLFGRYTFNDAEVSSSELFPGVFRRVINRHQYVTLEETKILSPTMLNVVRVGFNRTVPGEFPETPGIPESLSFVPGQPLGFLRVSGVTDFGGESGETKLQNTFQVLDNFTFLRGGHSLKLGFYVERIQDNFTNFSSTLGVYEFGSIQDFLENNPEQLEIAPPGSDLTRGVRQTLFAWYIQDDFQLTPSLTLNLGLRHEFHTVPTEVNGQLANIHDIFLTDPTDPPEMGGPPIVIGDPLFENPSFANFAPRVGLAWSPFGDGKTSVRSGFGIYYAPILTFEVNNTFTDNPPFNLIAQVTDPPIPFPDALDAQTDTASFDLRPKTTEFNPDSSYFMRWNLTLEREILPGTLLSVGYVGSKSVHLSHLRDVNMPLPTVIIDGLEFRAEDVERRNDTLGEVRQTAYDASSNFHSFQLGLKRRFSQGLRFQTAYTWSKSIDTASSGGGRSEFNQSTSIALSPENIGLDRGLSNFDVRNLSVSNFTYQLPFGAGRPYLSSMGGVGNALLGGWDVNSLVTFSSGTATTVRAGFDIDRNEQRSSDRPNLVPGRSNNPVLGRPKKSSDPYWDVNAFELQEDVMLLVGGVLVPVIPFGNLGRNTLIGPGLVNVDFSLSKLAPLTERLDLQFRFEIFNLFNRDNFAAPELPGLRDRKGRELPNAATLEALQTNPRELQFALRLVW